MRREADIFLTALMFYTRIPVPEWVGYAYQPEYMPLSARYLPLIGWLIGGMAALVFYLAGFIFPDLLAVLLSMVATIVVTGAFHEDGLADVLDGFGGGYTPEKVLSIMKDSRLGTYGTLGLILILALKGSALLSLTAIFPLTVWIGHSFSRAAAVSLMAFQDYARIGSDASKSSAAVSRLPLPTLLFVLITGLFPLLFAPAVVWLAVPGVACVTILLAIWFQRIIGGYTGDCLGAVQQISELTIYLIAAALFS
ncbi:MAG: adenosylcobinamide-GDP ribazoletransferase [Chloroflexota bacterium]